MQEIQFAVWLPNPETVSVLYTSHSVVNVVNAEDPVPEGFVVTPLHTDDFLLNVLSKVE